MSALRTTGPCARAATEAARHCAGAAPCAPARPRPAFALLLRCSLALLCALLLSSFPAHAEGESASPPVVDTSLSSGDVVVQSLGSADAKILVVKHGDSWSMHAENVLAQDIFRLWHEVGGPEVVMKTPLDFPYTLSVHRMSADRIVDRILEGYGRTMHFDDKGRLELVRTYSPKPARLYKTPRLVESLGTWRQVETAKATRPDGSTEESPVDSAASVPSTAPDAVPEMPQDAPAVVTPPQAPPPLDETGGETGE